ncbi:hypothetical protein [Rhizobium sp. BK176]|uniref:hypothetical protein n=1 Tax=Rhizobium sp. BK176 TaxID=2587071 RepID=UPI002167D99F|nr:hypothetical protein [Rhizobium sp. BK176]MCS4090016.1 hypothetical protein [Rhizobium sp. BK176]
MPVKIVASKQYTLLNAPFAWGFDVKDRRAITPADQRGVSPVSTPSKVLLERLAKAGWDVPELDVSLSIWDCRERGLFRYVSRVDGVHAGTPFQLEFNESITGDQYRFIPGAMSRFTLGGDQFPSDLREWSPDQVDLFEDAMLSVSAKLLKLPPSPWARNIKETGDANIRRFFSTRSIPAAQGFPVLYCWLPSDEKKSLPQGTVVAGHGGRLVNDSTKEDRALLPPRNFDCFDFASTDVNVKADQGTWSVNEKALPVEVRLKHLNEIYVMDMAPMDDARRAVTAAIVADGRKQSSREEQSKIATAAAKTMVPVTEYRGDFRRPVYCIGRHLLDDEARIMSGKVTVDYDGSVVSVTMLDNITGVVVPIFSNGNAGVGMLNHAVEIGRSIAANISCGFQVKESVVEAIRNREETNRRRWEAQQQQGPAPTM